MGEKINVTFDARTVQGKKVARLREEGVVPAVMYGQGFDPVLAQAPYGVVERLVRDAGRHTPVTVSIAGKKRVALIKDIDRDAVKQQIRHIALHAVKANEIVSAEVPLRLTGVGESSAEKAGLIILQAIEAVEVKAKPAQLPESLEISVLGLETGEDKISFADIQLPEGVEYADVEQDLDLVIANVYEPAALEAANEAAAGDADQSTEPEIEGASVSDTPTEE